MWNSLAALLGSAALSPSLPLSPTLPLLHIFRENNYLSLQHRCNTNFSIMYSGCLKKDVQSAKRRVCHLCHLCHISEAQRSAVCRFTRNSSCPTWPTCPKSGQQFGPSFPPSCFALLCFFVLLSG
jgi:hypothetical protein